MADVTVHVQLVPDLDLPYEPGAEVALADDDAAAFAAASAALGVALSLFPSFATPPEELGDFMAAARQTGSEPPDLFSFFGVSCPEELAVDVQAALELLPFVLRARVSLPQAPPSWSVVTDPATRHQTHLTRTPDGIDAYCTWALPSGGGRGVRVADVEQAWDLTHPDLIGVQRLSPFLSANEVDHGTYCVGLLGGASNDALGTGVAPHALVAVSPLGDFGTAEAILRAARHVGRGGIVLIEAAVPQVPPVSKNGADAPIEHNIPEWGAIRAAGALGVLVVEPAGNGSVDLDTDPLFSHISRPELDSGALFVASAENRTNRPAWTISLFSTRGTRIDCFMPGEDILGPTTDPTIPERLSRGNGTSPASALMAGVAATVQGLALQANGRFLSALELHARLRDRANGTLPTPLATPIGVMPDLAKLAAGLGLPRVPPLSAIAIAPALVVFARSRPTNLDEIEVLSIDVLSASSATLTKVSMDLPSARPIGHELALHASVVGGALIIDAVTTSEFGSFCHCALDLVPPPSGSPWLPLTLQPDPDLRISSPLSLTLASNRAVMVGLSVSGGVLALVAERELGSHQLVPTVATTVNPPTGREPELTELDPAIHFDATPALVSDVERKLATLLGVDRAGRLRHGTWSLAARWSGLELVAAGLDPKHPPAAIIDGSELHVVAIAETTREIQTTLRTQRADGSFDFSALRTVATPAPATFGIPLQIAGPIVAAGDGLGMLMALGLDELGRPLFSVRLPGFDWSPLLFVPSLTRFVPRGGLALASPAQGIFVAAACDASGAIHTARWNQVAWTPFLTV